MGQSNRHVTRLCHSVSLVPHLNFEAVTEGRRAMVLVMEVVAVTSRLASYFLVVAAVISSDQFCSVISAAFPGRLPEARNSVSYPTCLSKPTPSCCAFSLRVSFYYMQLRILTDAKCAPLRGRRKSLQGTRPRIVNWDPVILIFSSKWGSTL